MPFPTVLLRNLLPLLLLLSTEISFSAAQRMTPSKSREKTPRVAIIGGGIAGCAAAWHLKQTLGDAGVEIRIIEAGDYLGGRIKSVDSAMPAGGQPEDAEKIEMGANWIHGQKGNPLYEFA